MHKTEDESSERTREPMSTGEGLRDPGALLGPEGHYLEAATEKTLHAQALRAVLLASYFFLIITGYYLLKPLSRSLYITFVGSDRLPFVWIASVGALAIIVPLFHRLASVISASVVVHATTLSCVALLLVFEYLLGTPDGVSAFLFYVLVDVFSVILVEVFWSLANTSYREGSGKRWYGVLASGGLLGGIAGGAAASFLVDRGHFAPTELVLPACVVLLLALLLARVLFRLGFVVRVLSRQSPVRESFRGFFARLRLSREARAIVFILCFAQLIEPLVEYQFMATVERSMESLQDRTAFVSSVFAWVSAFGLAMSLLAVPVIHSVFGALGGLLAQPIMVGVLGCVTLLKGSLNTSSMLKVFDRGLSYSTGRASRELLYTRLDGDTNYRLKAWVDVLGYRLFRILGSVVVLGATTMVARFQSSSDIVMSFVVTLSLLWAIILLRMRPET